MRLQNRAVRIVTKTSPYERKSMTAEKSRLDIQPLEIRRKAQLLAMMYHRIQDDPSIRQPTPAIITRHPSERYVTLPHPKTESLKRAPVYAGAQAWNNLPSYIKEMDTIDSFKRAVKDHLSMLA